MLDFQLHMPTRIVFGRGEVEKVGAEAARIAGKVLLVTGRTATRKTGVLQRVLDSLAAATIKVMIDWFKTIDLYLKLSDVGIYGNRCRPSWRSWYRFNTATRELLNAEV